MDWMGVRYGKEKSSLILRFWVTSATTDSALGWNSGEQEVRDHEVDLNMTVFERPIRHPSGDRE